MAASLALRARPWRCVCMTMPGSAIWTWWTIKVALATWRFTLGQNLQAIRLVDEFDAQLDTIT